MGDTGCNSGPVSGSTGIVNVVGRDLGSPSSLGIVSVAAPTENFSGCNFNSARRN